MASLLDSIYTALMQSFDVEGDGALLRANNPPHFEIGLESRPDDGTVAVRCRVPIEPPLAMALSVTSKTTMDALLSSVTGPVVSGVFDAEFNVDAFDLVQARELLRGAVGSLLIVASHEGFQPSVDDHHVGMACDTMDGDEAVRCVRAAISASRTLVEQRVHVADSARLADLSRAWTPIAEQLGGTFIPDARRLRADLTGAALDVEIQRVAPSHWGARFDVEFAPALGVDLALRLASTISLWQRWTGGDIRVGDADFDDVFVIRGMSREQVTAYLDADRRGALSDLAVHCERLRLDAERLVGFVGWSYLDAETRMHEAIVAVVRAAEVLARTDRRRGPYR